MPFYMPPLSPGFGRAGTTRVTVTFHVLGWTYDQHGRFVPIYGRVPLTIRPA